MRKQINVRLEENLIKEIKIISIGKDLSFQDIVEISLKEWLIKNNIIQ